MAALSADLERRGAPSALAIMLHAAPPNDPLQITVIGVRLAEAGGRDTGRLVRRVIG